MDLEQGIKSPFSDKRWLEKTALGTLITMVPILNFASQGYALDYTRAVAYNPAAPLPEWQELGRFWKRGLFAGLAGLVLALPGILLMSMGVVPLIVGLITEQDIAILAGASTSCLFVAVALLYFLAISIFWGAAFTNYAMSEDFGAFFDIARIRTKISSDSGYFAAWGLSLLTYLIAGTIGGVIQGFLQIVPFAGSIVGSIAMMFITFLAQLISSHFYGQYASRAYAQELDAATTAQS